MAITTSENAQFALAVVEWMAVTKYARVADANH